jgi:hypothetical protein
VLQRTLFLDGYNINQLCNPYQVIYQNAACFKRKKCVVIEDLVSHRDRDRTPNKNTHRTNHSITKHFSGPTLGDGLKQLVLVSLHQINTNLKESFRLKGDATLAKAFKNES